MAFAFTRERRLLCLFMFACSPVLAAATPVTTSRASSSKQPQHPSKPTLSPRSRFGSPLKRQDQTQTCATLDGYSVEWAAPYVCSGSSPQCTAAGPLLGCCDSGDCTVYNTCYNAVDSSSCTGSCTSTALVCGDAAPSCSEYHIVDKSTIGVWTGFSCGTSAITLQGSPASGLLAIETPTTLNDNIETSTGTMTSTIDTTTSVTSVVTILTLSSSTRQSDPLSSHISSSLTLLPPPTGPSSTTSATTAASSSLGNGTAAASSSKSESHTEVGAATGGAIGGALVLGVVILALVRRQQRRHREIHQLRELGQPPYGDRR